MFLVATLNAFQARVSAHVTHIVGSGAMAALISFGTGTLILYTVCALSPRVGRAFLSVPRVVRSGNLSWWQCVGGAIGATFVTGQGLAVPTIGVVIFLVATVAGQSVASLFVDTWGLGPAGKKPVTLIRVVAAVVAVVGVGISATGRGTVGHVSWPLVACVFVVGGLTSGQHALNGQVARVTREPLGAATWNFSLGFICLTAVVIISRLIAHTPIAFPPAPWHQPLLWTSGIIGVLFIGCASIFVGSLGMLVFSLVVVIGQLVGGVILDLVLPTTSSEVNAQVLWGVVVTAIAVGIALLQSSRERMPVNE